MYSSSGLGTTVDFLSLRPFPAWFVIANLPIAVLVKAFYACLGLVSDTPACRRFLYTENAELLVLALLVNLKMPLLALSTFNMLGTFLSR
jgi:hypothetical protein